MSFDYSITCPIIDKQIDEAKSSFRSLAEHLLEEACPLLNLETKQKVAKSWAEEMYEAVRDTNQDMRKSAEKQIENLEDELSDSQYRIKELEAKVEALEDQVAELGERS